MAGASLGAGEWLIGPAITARYGGALLWITVLTLLAQYIYNVEASRYTLATGEGIMRLLDRINKTGTTVVMATHDQRIVNTMRKRVIQLDRGLIVRDQTRGVYE